MAKVAGSKPCEECRTVYAPTSNRQRWCSTTCAGEQRRGYDKPCSNPECDRLTSNGQRCNRCAARMYRNGSLELKPRKPAQPIVTPDGYVKVYVGHDQPTANAQGYAYQHRQVMADHLGRELRKFETVHHRNGNRQDNRLANLELWAKPQVPGQRVADLVAFVAEFYPDEVRNALIERGLLTDGLHPALHRPVTE